MVVNENTGYLQSFVYSVETSKGDPTLGSKRGLLIRLLFRAEYFAVLVKETQVICTPSVSTSYRNTGFIKSTSALIYTLAQNDFNSNQKSLKFCISSYLKKYWHKCPL